jgi:hypothetical protein
VSLWLLAEGVDWTVAGAAVIVASSIDIYIARRELRLGRRCAATASE